MKIDVAKLINEVSKHPQIYNPDHKDFSNKEKRNKIFNTVISKNMNGIHGETLQHKWNQILNKYANFIRKLSNDDSSEIVLEQFMKWPWTKPMRIFKPYVRKQFQIPEFQPATQLIPDVDVAHVPIMTLQHLHSIPMINEPSNEDATSEQGPELQGIRFAEQIPVVRYATLSTSTTNEGLSNANDTPTTSRPADTPLTHPVPEPSLEIPLENPLGLMEIPVISNMGFMGPEFLVPTSRFPRFLEDLNGMFSPPSSPHNFEDDDDGYNSRMGRNITAAIRRMIGRLPNDNINNDDGNNEDGNNDDDDDGGGEDDDDDENENENDDENENENDDENDDDDDNEATDEEGVLTIDDGPPNAKKRREQSSDDGDKDDKDSLGADGETNCTEDNEDDDQSDVLPDLPQPKPAVKRGPMDFTAQEHIFLAWAKTMSTFTAKRQATIKMQINKIMSEAEFEDLDDEFFAANRKPRRPIYTSRY